ncbi:MAG: CotH kinase family protein, partial [Desulfovibrio sp.]|nr:CotH kinase family protein [Desulfovibrio sp.]
KYPQHSYKMSLFTMSLGRHKRKNPIALLDMRRDEDWILYAPYNDPSKARNLLSTNLWWEMGAANNSFGIKNGAQARFIEVLLNGRYLGLYALTHQIDGRQLRLENNPDPLRAEYLYRKNGDKDAFSTDFRSARRNRAGEFELRFPKHPGTKFETWAPLASFLEVLGGPEELFRNRIAEKMEMDNAVDYWLFVNIVSGRDNLRKNTNYVAKLKDEKHVILFSPWDLDQTWGLNWTGVLPWLTALNGSPEEPLYREGELALIRCLALDLPGVGEKVRARYAALRATLLSGQELDRLLSACEADVHGSGAAARNRERWPGAAADTDPAALRKFVFARISHLDKAIADLAAPRQR